MGKPVDQTHPLQRAVNEAAHKLEMAKAERDEAIAANKAIKDQYEKEGKPQKVRDTYYPHTNRLPRDLSDARGRQAETARRLHEAEERLATALHANETRNRPYAEVNGIGEYIHRHVPRPTRESRRIINSLLVAKCETFLQELEEFPQRLSDLKCYYQDLKIEPPLDPLLDTEDVIANAVHYVSVLRDRLLQLPVPEPESHYDTFS